jgi:hypothetical protein
VTVARPNIKDHDMPGNWVIEKQRSHYTIGYWLKFVLGQLGQMVPEPPDITYTVRDTVSGQTRTLTLPGDHKPADLDAAIAQESGPVGV